MPNKTAFGIRPPLHLGPHPTMVLGRDATRTREMYIPAQVSKFLVDTLQSHRKYWYIGGVSREKNETMRPLVCSRATIICEGQSQQMAEVAEVHAGGGKRTLSEEGKTNVQEQGREFIYGFFDIGGCFVAVEGNKES